MTSTDANADANADADTDACPSFPSDTHHRHLTMMLMSLSNKKSSNDEMK